MKQLLYSILVFFCLFSTGNAHGSKYANQSVLNTGKWVKIKIDQNGVYKLTTSDLRKMGFSDLDKVAVYGYGGWPLNENFSTTYLDDLPELSLWKTNDYILFYGKGPVKWEYTQKDGFVHTNNPYSTSGYYFVTQKENSSKQMDVEPSEAGTALQITTFDDYYLWEKDQVSVNNSGRRLFGESFETSISQDFSVNIPGITSDPGLVTLRFISKATTNTGLVSLSIDDQPLLSKSISRSPSSDSYVSAIDAYSSAEWTGEKKANTKVNIRYNTTGHKNVRLDYFRLQMKRELKPYDGTTFFRSLSAINNLSRFVISEANSGYLVFDVSDGVSPKVMETKLEGSVLSFTVPSSSSLREFVLVQPASLKSPEVVGEVKNQNLHALMQSDMVIIAQPGLSEQANRLAEAHRAYNNLSVIVVTPESLYNEFSSGTPDATAYRRFMKMLYDRQTSEADAPKYLLLFGDGSYDNRQLTSTWKSVDMTNMLLTYQTEESLNENSYVVDDYFGFLNDADNIYDLAYKKVDIGIGRLPVRTVNQATQVVSKIISYIENKRTGMWKNRVCFVADDGSSIDSYSQDYMNQAEVLANYMNESCPEFLTNKIYFDAYKKDQTGGQNGYPDVRVALQKQLKDGLFLLNYTGHGSTTAWADEKVLTQTDINQFSYTALPVWITATCDFTRFDDLNTSAGEDVFLSPNSGGIALLTTTRVAYSSPNAEINKKLIQELFTKDNTANRTLGDVMKAVKRTVSGLEVSVKKLGFCLIGDPALKLTYPEYRLKVTSVNGQPADGDTIIFSALQKITVEGYMCDYNGNKTESYNGLLHMTVKDSKTTVTCLDNNKTGKAPFTYVDYPNTLYTGNDSVKGGRFSFSFVVPKDISYSGEQGLMNLYMSDEENGVEAQGDFANFRVGGSSENVEPDTEGPEIRMLYLNDSTFVEGGRVNPTPFFVAQLWDKSGVNISGSSIGHDMMLIIDESYNSAYTLNDYYELIPDQDGQGMVKFSIPQLAPGLHTAEFWAWDIHNNSTVYSFTFEVVEGLKPFLYDVFATPNPVRDYVTFHITHNRPESWMKVDIQLYDLAGRLLWKHQESGSSDIFKAYTVVWDLRSNAGARLRPGVYIYRAAISTDNSKEATKAKKMIILSP